MMKKSLLNIAFALGLLISLSGCTTVYEAFIGVDSDTKDRFAAIPASCESELGDADSISICTRELMPLGREYGLLALQRIRDYGEYAKPATKEKLPEFKEKIEQNCFAHIDHADKLFDAGEQDVAVEIALGSLSDCFFRGDAVMERSYGGMDVSALRQVTDRVLETLYQDHPV